ncbi:MAG: polysaccharide deacetylase family protein, partial [Tepidisphaeraceae bacterium]
PSDRADLILARRAPVHFNTPATRWAVLPGAAAEAMAALWEAEGHAPVNAPAAGARRVVYDPNLLQQSPDFVPPIPTSLLTRIANRLSRVPSDFATSGLMLGFAPASMARSRPRRLARAMSTSMSARRADVTCERIPILMYHRVAPSGADMNRQWRVTPQEFEQQLAHLEKSGYHSVSFESWRDAAHAHTPLPGRGVIITFDDGFVDFAEHAWPLMKKFGFEANMFLVAGLVGRCNQWDLHRGGERVSLMDWNTIRQLQQEGVRFGAHTVSHPHLTGVSIDRCATELVESRVILQRELGRVVNGFAYPFGDHDEAVQHLAGACGYDFAVTCDGGYANHDNRMLALPRVEVDGKADPAAFAASVQWV